MMITQDALRTIRDAIIVTGLLFALLASYAGVHGGLASPKPQNEAQRFMSGGLHNSQARLARELNMLHPVGSDAGSLLHRLAREGFECQADTREPGSYGCVFNRPLSFQRVARLETRVDTDGRNIASILPKLSVAPAPLPHPSLGLLAVL